MRTTLLVGLIIGLLWSLVPDAPALAQFETASGVVMAVHGGAGSIEETDMTAAEETAYRTKLTEALEVGYEVVTSGGRGVDAVVAALSVLETSPLFNAGRGAVFTEVGTVMHDASIMEGENRRSGAVAAVMHVAHPIQLARLVMEESEYIFFVGEGAEEFALEHGMELVPNESFYTEERKERFLRGQLSGRAPGAPAAVEEHYGTVGAVVIDQAGTLAAGTSTGGTGGKPVGRVGDSPIVGAGTYADNATCAVSATGWGEYFIRGVVAHDVAAMMRYAEASITEAARTVIHEHLPGLGNGEGTGGVIALDREGTLAVAFNTPGMFRGWIDEAGNVTVHFYGGEE